MSRRNGRIGPLRSGLKKANGCKKNIVYNAQTQYCYQKYLEREETLLFIYIMFYNTGLIIVFYIFLAVVLICTLVMMIYYLRRKNPLEIFYSLAEENDSIQAHASVGSRSELSDYDSQEESLSSVGSELIWRDRLVSLSDEY